jgi:hypothetical protein
MSSSNSTEVTIPVLKVVSAWAAVGITSWTDIAAVLAAIYTALLLIEFLWKRVGRQIAVCYGWISPKRRKDDEAEE